MSAPGYVDEMEDPFKATGLGAAIQSAATGRAPGEKLGDVGAHTEGQARVMHHTVDYLESQLDEGEFPST